MRILISNHEPCLSTKHACSHNHNYNHVRSRRKTPAPGRMEYAVGTFGMEQSPQAQPLLMSAPTTSPHTRLPSATPAIAFPTLALQLTPWQPSTLRRSEDFQASYHLVGPSRDRPHFKLSSPCVSFAPRARTVRVRGLPKNEVRRAQLCLEGALPCVGFQLPARGG
ncbi:hypothetical protein BV22DRAFT_793010 [Leucogyrophana mollusca]|uniref:Uncharacterized protein n=1 Tax=Leucogyrophana mollusca TaxID=85980 RepID=A0ACB8B4K5_9AGAM|nr:hypothetical protein BV22DRAFT_793010 [Leucogyrophana mollusca]